MKKTLKKIANKCGYRISRLSNPNINAFTAMQYLLKEVKEPIIFDVGACYGYISLAFRKMFPLARIYAFEPFEESFECLKANTISDELINIFNFGLSNREGTQSFHSNKRPGTNSLLATHESSEPWGKGYVETKEIIQARFNTLDSVIETMKIPRIDLLKLDVQGAEPLVIEGASEACSRGIIRLIYSEIITQPTYKDQKRFDEALGSFYNSGFDLYNIYNMDLTREGRLRQVDAIFTKR